MRALHELQANGQMHTTTQRQHRGIILEHAGLHQPLIAS
jgi:hypothetical protein